MQQISSIDNLNLQVTGKDLKGKNAPLQELQPNTVFEEYDSAKLKDKDDAVLPEQDLEEIDYSDFSSFETQDLINEYKDMIAKGEISKKEATEILAGAMSMITAAYSDKSYDLNNIEEDDIFGNEKFEDMLDKMEDRDTKANLLGNFIGTASKWLS